jgi:hypothetical protein
MPPFRVKFTKPYLDKLLKQKPKAQVTIWDETVTGLCILHSPGKAHQAESTVTFRACYYLKDQPGVPKYVKIGRYGQKEQIEIIVEEKGELKRKKVSCDDIESVRTKYRQIRDSAKGGSDPKRPSMSGNVKEIIERYLKQRASKNKTAGETKRIFDVYVLPEWQDKNLEDIQRSDITALLHKVADGKIKYENKSGKTVMIGTPNVASAVLSQISALFSWYAAKYATDRYRTPIVKGMAESDWLSKARKRALSAEEIRALWQATADFGVYGAAIRMALLTAQRFFKVGHMRRGQIVDGIWDAREKDDAENKQVSEVPLSPLALEIINSVPIIDAGRWSEDFVFSLDGKKPFNGWSNAKEMLDKKMAQILGRKLEPWQHRDLRRTAKTLMGRAGVSREISERCLAHVIPGVEGVYDQYDYLREKREAFQKLSVLIERILGGEASFNVGAV